LRKRNPQMTDTYEIHDGDELVATAETRAGADLAVATLAAERPEGGALVIDLPRGPAPVEPLRSPISDRYPTLHFIPSSRGWEARLGEIGTCAATREAALGRLYVRLGWYAYRDLADDDCYLCFGEGHHAVAADGSAVSLTQPIRIECAHCEGTGRVGQFARDLRGDHDSPLSYAEAGS
jgi:hypothetical protein